MEGAGRWNDRKAYEFTGVGGMSQRHLSSLERGRIGRCYEPKAFEFGGWRVRVGAKSRGHVNLEEGGRVSGMS